MKLLKRGMGKLIWSCAFGVGLMAAPLGAAEPGAESLRTAESERHHVWLTFGLDRIPGLGLEVMGNPLWQYLAFLVYVLLAF